MLFDKLYSYLCFRLIKDAGNEEERNQNPRSYANIFEILTFR